MTSKDVWTIYSELKDNGIEIWLDGGWGVDALLGEITRTHSDLDIVVQKKDLPQLRKYLESKGFKDIQRDDTWAWNFVLDDSSDFNKIQF